MPCLFVLCPAFIHIFYFNLCFAIRVDRCPVHLDSIQQLYQPSNSILYFLNLLKFDYSINQSKFFFCSPIYIFINNKQQMSANQNPSHQADFDFLDQHYPGINRMNLKLSGLEVQKVSVLANLIKYNVPKAFYTLEIVQLDQKIQQLYFQCLVRANQNCEQTEYCLAQIDRKKSQLSDQEEAEVIRQANSQAAMLNIKFSISQVQQFIKMFDCMGESKFVNPSLIKQIDQFSKVKKQKSVYQNYDKKQKQREKDKQKLFHKNRKNSHKNRQQPENDRKQKIQINITLGHQIPLEVKQMRNYVKKVSLQSFAVNSIKSETQKSEIEKQKIFISLSLNKVAKDNLKQIFQQFKQFILESEELATFFISQTIAKCVSQYRMSDAYLSLCCLFTKIPCSKFSWKWRPDIAYSNTKINQFHRLLVEKLEQAHENCIKDIQQSKNVKYLNSAIGKLILRRKLSKKIYFQLTNCLIETIFSNKSNEGKQLNSDYLQAEIFLIEALQNYQNKIWEEYHLREILTLQNQLEIKSISNGVFPQTIQQLLILLNAKVNDSNIRIGCLIQNLFERRHNLRESVSAKAKQPSQQFGQAKIKQLILQDLGIEKLAKEFDRNKDFHFLLKAIINLVDGKKSQILYRIKQFSNKIGIGAQQFMQFWDANYLNFVYSECDLPFMADGLAVMMRILLNSQATQCIRQCDKQDEDYEDVNQFMNKLHKKLKQVFNLDGK